MSGERPAARDQPSPEESAALAAILSQVLEQRRKIVDASVEVRGPGSRRVFVNLTGDVAWLALTDQGAIEMQRTTSAATVLQGLGAAPSFEDLESFLHALPAG